MTLSWRCATWFALSAFYSYGVQDQDWLTIRWYGRKTDRFKLTKGWPEDASEVCFTFPAVCVDIPMGRCVQMPAEFRAPWDENITRKEPDKYARETPWDLSGGYMIIANHELRYTENGEQPRQLFVGCEPGCNTCISGTGYALAPALREIDMRTGMRCQVSLDMHSRTLYSYVEKQDEAGVFMIWYNPGDGSVDSRKNCVESLNAYWSGVEESKSKRSLIIGLLIGSTFLLGSVCVAIFAFRVRKQQQWQLQLRLQALHEGTADFTILSSSSAPTVISQRQIEVQFPITEVDEAPTCTVCLEPVTSTGRKLQCGHAFHADCIMQWWVHRPRRAIECPVCKRRQHVEALLDPTEAQYQVDPAGTPAAQVVGTPVTHMSEQPVSQATVQPAAQQAEQPTAPSVVRSELAVV